MHTHRWHTGSDVLASATRAVRALTPRDAAACARLHRNGIPTGFLSSLGLPFLRELYRAIPICSAGFGYVWAEGGPEILGFVACAQRTGQLYKQVLLRRGPFLLISVSRFLVRPAAVRRMLQTLRYPAAAPSDLPAAEVLASAVARRARGRGVGRALLKAALAGLAARGCAAARVAVWDRNEGANAFYRRCCFALAHTRTHHGLGMNIYVAPTG
jgi:ribosomal protein S18 acetylase RimI-like enzyme